MRQLQELLGTRTTAPTNRRGAPTGARVRGRGAALAAILGALALGGLGCETVSTARFDALRRLSVAMAEARKDYKVQPGDTVKVVVFREGQLPPEYQQTVTVQPDGRITLVNVDRAVEAEGKTVPELQTIVRQLYAQVFQQVPFEITVQFLTSEKNAWLPDQVYVSGEVARPLPVPYRKGITVLQAIASVGGWKYTAEPSRVTVLRSDSEGRTVSTEINIYNVIDHEGDDFELEPGDVVFVPLSTIAQMNIVVEFYIRGLIPLNPSVIRTLAVGI